MNKKVLYMCGYLDIVSFIKQKIVKKMKEIVPEYISNNSVYSILDKKQ